MTDGPDTHNRSSQHERELIRLALQEAQDEQARAEAAPAQQIPFTPPAEFLPGYSIQAEIHRGGQGVVYRATQQSTQRDVAVKVLRRGALDEASDQARFDREVRILAQLKHPNIVTIHDRAVAAGSHCFVMDYIDGRPLDRFVEARALSTTDTIRLFIKVCAAVHAAHLRGVIHRDLKPGNVLVDQSGEPHVLDFGLAKRAAGEDDAPDSELTVTGQFVGTLAWASPEQASGTAQDVDMRSDVYSLGLMLYQALTGTMPYSTAQKVPKLIQAITQEPPVRPSDYAPDIKGDLETIVLKCLSKDPARRYETAGGLAADLKRLLNNEPIEARRDSSLYLLRMFTRRHRTAALVAVAFVAVLAASSITLAFMYADQVRLAAEIKQVATFQASQLAGVDMAVMGARLRSDLLDRAESAMALSDADKESVAQQTSELERWLAGVNFTDLARRALDENILQRTAEAVDTQFSDQPLVRARLLQSLGETMLKLGLVEPALPPLTEAHSIRRRALGEDRPETLDSMNSVCNWYIEKGQLGQARVYCHTALETARLVLGNDHEVTLDAIGHMATWLWQSGRLEEAMSYFEEALSTRRQVLGDDHSETLQSLSLLGRRYEAFGRSQQALRCCSEALGTARRVFGNEHPQTLLCMNTMANLLRAMGRFDEARSLHEEALATSKRMLGDDHPTTVVFTNSLAYLLEQMGQYDEAMRHYDAALSRYGRLFGRDNPNTYIITRNLGRTLQLLGRYDEAEQHLTAAADGFRRLLGEEHPDTIKSAAQMGALYQLMGRWESAEEHFLRAAELACTLPPNYKLPDGILRNVVRFYEAWHAAKPEVGYDKKAAEWQAKRNERSTTDGAD